jgi:hypothetical protein
VLRAPGEFTLRAAVRVKNDVPWPLTAQRDYHLQSVFDEIGPHAVG